MSRELINVYLMPGMAANPSIFEHIQLPDDKFKIHWLKWIMPLIDETMANYAKRMTKQIKHENIVLLGVSFGGILVQEISKYVSVRQLFVVSSIVCNKQIPKRFKIAKKTKAYKLLPTQLIGSIDLLAKYAFGEFIIKRINLYRKYLSVTDKIYLDWAIKQMVYWNQEIPPNGVIQIHGDKDGVFTNSCDEKCIVVKGGTHIMIINKYKWFNENLPKLILN
ncbi:MAG: alpha/beta hydrolase [Flavobacteriaceae bacterium]|nr:alpha/beta hydrolase [Bacteroidia bacterium]NNL16950.1 alpha/beta hydrolase [Flavobacteriaceae bacterium]